jgi:predicted aldo/keto reductase-like oxidoreductase
MPETITGRAAGPMRRARIGRTGVELSVVGLGTCSLRLLPEERAYTTLRRALDEGVDWFHTSSDYEGADELVARAIRDSGRRAFAVADGSGAPAHFHACLARARRLAGTDRLELFGISCIDEQEYVGHDVWGAEGMVETLLAEKRAGRIGAVFCTTHGTPEYVQRLVTCGVFDAVMLAYNPLGFHVLSYDARAEGKRGEDLARTFAEVLPLAAETGVSILVMKALGGGLLATSQASPPRTLLVEERRALRAEDILRHILSLPGVTAVLPGAGTPEEAGEDAHAGHGPPELEPERQAVLEARLAVLQSRLCSRCGACEPTCSRGLPVSWLFRDAYMWLNPSDTFDAVPRLSSAHLLAGEPLACHTCTNPTCMCPAGLDVRSELTLAQDALTELGRRGLLPLTPSELDVSAIGDEPRAIVVQRDTPLEGPWRLWLQNAGRRVWRAEPGDDHVELVVRDGVEVVQRVRLRYDCHPGERVHFAFEPPRPRTGLERSFTLQQGRGARTLRLPLEARP